MAAAQFFSVQAVFQSQPRMKTNNIFRVDNVKLCNIVISFYVSLTVSSQNGRRLKIY